MNTDCATSGLGLEIGEREVARRALRPDAAPAPRPGIVERLEPGARCERDHRVRIRARLAQHDELVHVSLEVNRCPHAGGAHAA